MAKKTTEKKATTKRNYTVNQDERTVSFIIGTLTDTEKAEIDEFQSYGYKVIADIKKARKAAKGITYEEMKKAAKGKPYEKELLKMIADKTNYMKVRKFFNESNK